MIRSEENFEWKEALERREELLLEVVMSDVELRKERSIEIRYTRHRERMKRLVERHSPFTSRLIDALQLRTQTVLQGVRDIVMLPFP